MAQLLGDTALDPVQRSYVETIRTSGELLLAVINDILDYSKIEAERLELEVRPCDPAEVVNEVVELLGETARKKGLALRREREEGLPDRVMVDATRLQQVLLNLAGNALKFTAKGEVVIGLRRHVDELGATQLAFAVSDTGIGVPEDRKERLFKPFSQGDASVTRKYGGTGLGLAICHRIVGLMGGRIWMEAKEGGGSVFQFTVDAIEPPPEMRAEPLPERWVWAGFAKRYPLRLMVAEDNEVNRRVVLAMLSKLGYEDPLVVFNGAEAVEVCALRHPEVILMDVQMPELDGYTATALIRAASASTPDAPVPWIIALTADARSMAKNQAKVAGMDDFLTKPLRMEALAEALVLAQGVQQERAAAKS